jgi:O-antigen ligase
VLADLAAGAILLGFLAVFMQPAIVNPFELDQVTAWIVVCYAFAGSILLVRWRRVIAWQRTPFDDALLVYLAIVLITWTASVNRHTTAVSVVRLVAQIGVYAALRVIAADWPALGEKVVAALIAGIAVLEWTALDYHLRSGLSASRFEVFPPLEWNGRTGLGALSAVQFALLVGIAQWARDRIRIAAMILMAGVVVEMILLYARLPWVAAVAVLVGALVVAVPTGGVRRYAAIVGTAGLVAAGFGSSYVVHLIKMMIGLESGAEGGLDIRTTLWHNAVSMIRDHPLMGVGLGNYLAVHQRMYPVPFPAIHPEISGVTHPHNLFLQQTAELGIIGGVAYAALWGVALWLAWRATTRHAPQAHVSAGLFYALITLIVINMGENIFLDQDPSERVRVHTLAWIAIGLAVAQWRRVCALRPDSRATACGVETAV